MKRTPTWLAALATLASGTLLSAGTPKLTCTLTGKELTKCCCVPPKGWEAALHADEEDDRQVLLQRDVAKTRAVTERKAKPLLIGQLSKLAGVKPDSVRFYERSGLFPKPERSPSGYRVYKPAAVNRLRFIKKAQALGFSLDEIGRILSLQGQGSTCCESVLAIAETPWKRRRSSCKHCASFMTLWPRT